MSSPTLDDLIARAQYTCPGLGNNLGIRMVLRGGVLQLVMSGASAGSIPEELNEQVSAVLRMAQAKRVAVDLSQCPVLPSVAIAFLVYFQKAAEDCGARKVVLYSVSPRIVTVLGMIGMRDFFVIVANEADMVRWFENNGG